MEQILKQFTELLDSFWMPVFSIEGHYIKRYAASIIFSSNSINEAFLKLLSANNDVAAKGLLRNQLDNCIEVQRLLLIKDKQKYITSFFNGTDGSTYKEGNIQYSSRYVRKQLSTKYSWVEDAWSEGNDYVHPSITRSEDAQVIGLDSTFDSASIIIYNLTNYKLEDEDIIDKMAILDNLLIQLLNELKEYQTIPNYPEELNSFVEKVKKNRICEVVYLPDVNKATVFRTNFINGEIDKQLAILLKSQMKHLNG